MMERILLQLDKLDAKIDKLDDHVKSIDVTLARNTLSLEVHMKRCDALESLVDQNKRGTDVVKADVSAIYTVLYFGRWFLGCGVILAGVSGLIKMLL